mmetsp:Transcript_126070/g.315013  ORF Transcript_126070/g.315013 Transcript_126070/m.315013 type:complete len:407 (-) Transcript_126070:90-1310(-)
MGVVDPLDLACCCISLLIFGVIGLTATIAWSGQQGEAQAWGVPNAWKTQQCKVHSVGVSRRGGCWMSSPHHAWGADPDPSFFSECPGWHWCANEGQTCEDCNGGDVLFAAASFAGTVPVGNQSAVLQKVDGPVVCSADTFGSDPMPQHTKFCFCKPASITELLHAKGPLEPEGTNCTSLANDAFDLEARGIKQSRRLGLSTSDQQLGSGVTIAVPPESLMREATGASPSNAAVTLAQQKWQLPDGHCNYRFWMQFNGEYQVYLPWALVEVQDEGSSKLRCAYSYGAEVASREEWDQAHKFYKAWKAKESSDMACYVREHGVCGLTGCAVALERPVDMGSQDITSRQFRNGLYYAFCILFALSPLMFLCYIQLRRHVHRGEDFGDGSEDEEEEEESIMDDAVKISKP